MLDSLCTQAETKNGFGRLVEIVEAFDSARCPTSRDIHREAAMDAAIKIFPEEHHEDALWKLVEHLSLKP